MGSPLASKRLSNVDALGRAVKNMLTFHEHVPF